MGKGILLALIQIGGLGIMTFTGFFSYIFLGPHLLRIAFFLRIFFPVNNWEGLYKLLLKILLFTMLVEAAGAVVIYQILDGDWIHKTHATVFHSISAFCNAGISQSIRRDHIHPLFTRIIASACHLRIGDSGGNRVSNFIASL